MEVFQDDEVDSFDLSLMHMNDTHARVENYPNLITAIKDFQVITKILFIPCRRRVFRYFIF